MDEVCLTKWNTFSSWISLGRNLSVRDVKYGFWAIQGSWKTTRWVFFNWPSNRLVLGRWFCIRTLQICARSGVHGSAQDPSVDNALRQLGKMFLENIKCRVGNITTFNRNNGEMLQWPAFEQFLGRDDGLSLRSVGQENHNSTPLGVNTPPAPEPEVADIEGV